MPDPTEPDALRRAYGTFPSGVTALCAVRDGAPVGIAASSFVCVSMDPPLVSVCVQHTSTTWPLLADLPRLGLSVLGATHERVCRQLASKTGDRFAGVGHTTTDEGTVLLHDAAAWLDCSVHEAVTAGDHDLVLLKVEALQTHDGVPPLVFHSSRPLAAQVDQRLGEEPDHEWQYDEPGDPAREEDHPEPEIGSERPATAADAAPPTPIPAKTTAVFTLCLPGAEYSVTAARSRAPG